MKNLMNKWMAAIALVSCVACSKTETDIDKAAPMNENGKVYGYFEPLIDDDAPETRGYRTPSFSYIAEVDDQVSIWTSGHSYMGYRIGSVTSDGHFELVAEDFNLVPGKTYYASYPFVLQNVVNRPTSQDVTYEGQTQTDQTGNQLRDLAKYVYCWASSECDENQNTSFRFRSIGPIIRMIITLPKAGMTISEVKLTADSPIFALNGKADFTNGSFTATGALSESLTMDLEDVTVSGNVLTAYLGSAPLPAAKYVISVTDDHEKVYKSSEIEMPERGAHTLMKFDDVVVESEEREYELVTSMPSDPAGKYILVYSNGSNNYRVFSFLQAMENAELAAASVSGVSGIDNLFGHASPIYNQVVKNDCVDITSTDATKLVLTPEQEAELALTIAANSAPWTVTAPAKDLQTTLSATTASGKTYTVPVDHLVGKVDGSADLVAAFNAPGVVAGMNTLRNSDVNVTFDQLIDLLVNQTDALTTADGAILKRAFPKLYSFGKSMIESRPEIFGNEELMPISLTTNAFTVFSQYYDNVAKASWAISTEKRFGLATIGYDSEKLGFTYNVGMPNYGWFDCLNEAFKKPRTEFVSYWSQFDDDYVILGENQFFTKFATKLLAALEPYEEEVSFYGTTIKVPVDPYALLQGMANQDKFSAVGQTYKTFAAKLNAELEPVYIYKKVQ